MLNRFGLVIHWIGFIGSVGGIGFVLFIIATEDFSGASIEDWTLLAAIAFGPLGSVWAIRFILTGHKGLMPWSKAKQPESTEN